MTIGIVGLGLIGGSMAKAYREYSNESGLNFKIYGYNRSESTLNEAIADGTVTAKLDESTVPLCDLILVGLYPESSIEYIRQISPYIRNDAYVIDLCGTKELICNACFALADEYGYTFVGGHPMAGTHKSGYKFSRSNMFHGAPMVFVPKDLDDIPLRIKLTQMLSPAGFGMYSFTTAVEHDRMIAFTSQLAHVVSNAYVKSPTAKNHKGFSAGSYKDLTRVAWLNETMWTELFFENKKALTFEIDQIISSLSEYRDALSENDRDKMKNLLRDGRVAKEEIDGEAEKAKQIVD